MDFLFIIGTAAGILTTIAFLPQVLQAHKSKHTKDLSLSMYILFSIGLILWTIYGFLIASIPVIIGNTVTMVLSFYLIYLKV